MVSVALGSTMQQNKFWQSALYYACLQYVMTRVTIKLFSFNLFWYLYVGLFVQCFLFPLAVRFFTLSHWSSPGHQGQNFEFCPFHVHFKAGYQFVHVIGQSPHRFNYITIGMDLKWTFCNGHNSEFCPSCRHHWRIRQLPVVSASMLLRRAISCSWGVSERLQKMPASHAPE